MINIEMMQIIQIKQDVVNKFEEENRQDVIAFVREIASNILEGEEVNEEMVETSATHWFNIHKNHIEEFAEELTEYAEILEKAIKSNKKNWIKK